MIRKCASIWSILLLIGTTMFIANCLREPAEGTLPPTPTPVPAGSFIFEPSRVSAGTRAVAVKITNLVSQRMPVVEHSIVITEPTTVREITAMLLAATSTACAAGVPIPRQSSGYGIRLELYSRSDIDPLRATSTQWMLAEVSCYPEVNSIGVYRPEGRGQIIEICPVETALREILERELAIRGLTFPR